MSRLCPPPDYFFSILACSIVITKLGADKQLDFACLQSSVGGVRVIRVLCLVLETENVTVPRPDRAVRVAGRCQPRTCGRWSHS